MDHRPFALLAVVITLGAGVSAQTIPIRTIPLAQGDQYLIFPSDNLGRGGVAIALTDSSFDPFRNPALGARAGAFRAFSAPTLYSISRGTGGGRTLPLGIVGRAGRWFGAASAAIQEVDASGPMSSPVIVARPVSGAQDVVTGATGPSHGNTYAFGSLGRASSTGGLALGASVLWSRLGAVDALDLLYPNSVGISENGHGVDLRVGLLKEWPGSRSLEALLLHDRFHLTHDVSYVDAFWDPAAQQFVQSPRVEHNVDRASTTGLHVAYQRPLGGAGWRVGWIGTANFVASPRISPSDVVTIPRDQGRSAAYNVGVGLSKTRDRATFGIDAIYEPIWSTTWAVADAPLATTLGDTIPTGGRTIEYRYHFSNVVLRLGVSRDLPLATLRKAVGLELGLAVRAQHYRLVQNDRLAGTLQPFRTGWVEWSPTWGLSLRFPELELHYRGRVQNGGGRPSPFVNFGPLTGFGPGDILLPPGGSSSTLNLAGVTTITHQISLSLPLR